MSLEPPTYQPHCSRCSKSAGTWWEASGKRRERRVFLSSDGKLLCDECLYKESVRRTRKKIEKGLDTSDSEDMMLDRLAEMYGGTDPTSTSK